MSTRPVIAPANVHIRRYQLSDVSDVFEAVRESLTELQAWMPWSHPAYSIHESRSWLQAQIAAFDQRTAFEFAMIDDDGRYLGACGLNQIDHANRRANLGYWVRTSATNQGVATRAVRVLRDWAFAYTDLIRLEIVIAIDNVASCRVAEKAGAFREGTLKNRLLLHGAAHDAAVFSFTRTVPGVRV
jgi:RimJ/RimL family protein N-acetyltransferase